MSNSSLTLSLHDKEAYKSYYIIQIKYHIHIKKKLIQKLINIAHHQHKQRSSHKEENKRKENKKKKKKRVKETEGKKKKKKVVDELVLMGIYIQAKIAKTCQNILRFQSR